MSTNVWGLSHAIEDRMKYDHYIDELVENRKVPFIDAVRMADKKFNILREKHFIYSPQMFVKLET